MNDCETIGIIIRSDVGADPDASAAMAHFTWALSNGYHVDGSMNMEQYGALLQAFNCDANQLIGKPCFMTSRGQIHVFREAWVAR